jgi:hypothetical protein
VASIDWPSSLPAGRQGSFSDGRTAAWAEDDKQEVGAARRRKRFTRTLRTFSFDLVLTDTQWATLETFVDDTTNGGVEAFNWTHPRTAVIYETRFSEVPTAKHNSGTLWTVSVSLMEI